MRRAIQGAILLAVASALPAAIVLLVHPELKSGPVAPLREHEVGLATALAWGNRVIWVDAREAREFEAGHITGAISIAPGMWEVGLVELLDRWQPESRIVVYCDAVACDLSESLAARLREEAGFENVHFLRGGWQAWEGRGK